MRDPVRFQSRFKLTFGRRPKRPHPYPACAAAMAQENETQLEPGVLSQIELRFVHPDLPGLIRSGRLRDAMAQGQSSGFHHGSLDNDAGRDIFPQRYQQLARQRDDGGLPHATAVSGDPLAEPER